MNYTVGSTVKQRHPGVMHRSPTKVNPYLIIAPLTPITYTSAQLHENYTHWYCLVPQKGRGWLIKYWRMFDLILASFLQGEGMVQRMDGWPGRRLPNNWNL